MINYKLHCIMLALSSSSYEKVCLLFNIAAMQSQVACVQDHTSDAALQLTAKLFQVISDIYISGHNACLFFNKIELFKRISLDICLLVFMLG